MGDTMASDYRYWGFISYTNQDRKWTRWLHHALEAYSVPSQFVGTHLGD